MKTTTQDHSIIDLTRFIQATRDSGYKNTTSAIAELIDNSIQAGATIIDVTVEPSSPQSDHPIQISVSDNGCGMSTAVLRQALRFGGSTRFGKRDGMGRFGMGLPNASLSQARRVEVVTWTRRQSVWSSWLDVDEIASGGMAEVPKPVRCAVPAFADQEGADSGTVVQWLACDRLDHRRISTLERKIQAAVGRTFRHFLWSGTCIRVNDIAVIGVDPLYLNSQSPVSGAELAEPAWTLPVENPHDESVVGEVTVTFTELPVEEWCDLPVKEKRRRGVSNGAGVSIVRAGREIDYGWFFMGGKRRENYDDWWRCEISFEPDLDEAFGITHTKQQVRPQDWLQEALSPHLEAMAKTLNARVRERHSRAKAATKSTSVEVKMESRDCNLASVPKRPRGSEDGERLRKLERKHRSIMRSLDEKISSAVQTRYHLIEDSLPTASLFETLVENGRVVVVLNTKHSFFRRVIRPLEDSDRISAKELMRVVQSIVLACGRAEAMFTRKSDRHVIKQFSKHLGRALDQLSHD